MAQEYELIPGGGVMVPFPQVGEGAGEAIGGPMGTLIDAVRDGARGTGPLAAPLDWLEQNGGPFASGLVKGLKRSLGGPETAPTNLPASECELIYDISVKVYDVFGPGEAPNSQWTRGQASYGGAQVKAEGNGVRSWYVDSNGATQEGFTSFPSGQSWNSKYGPAEIKFRQVGTKADGSPCGNPPGQPPLPPSPTAPIVPVPPTFVPPFLPIPVAPGGPIVLAPVVPIIPVFIDADVNIDADFNFDVRPQIQVGPFNIQIGPKSVEIRPTIPGRETPRLPPGEPRPDPGNPVPPTRPPQLPPSDGAPPCESVWTKAEKDKVLEDLKDIEDCACGVVGEPFSVFAALEPAATLSVPKGRRMTVRVDTTTAPLNARTQPGGGSAPDVIFSGWWSFGPNGAGERRPVHYASQVVPIGDQPESFKVTVTLYEGHKGLLTVSGYAYPD